MPAAQSEIEKKKKEAEFPGLTPEQRLQFELVKQTTQSITALMQTLAQTGVNMPGVYEMSPIKQH